MLGSLTKDLSLLRTVDAVKANAFACLIVQDFDGIAIQDSHYLTRKFPAKTEASIVKKQDMSAIAKREQIDQHLIIG